MTMSVDASKIDAIEAKLKEALEAYGGNLNARISDGFTGFLKPYSENEGTQTNANQILNRPQRDSRVRQEASVRPDDRLRAEADKRVKDAIEDRLSTREERQRCAQEAACQRTCAIRNLRKQGALNLQTICKN